MAIQIAATRQTVANAYGAIATSSAPYVGLHTGVPGSAGTADEATGGTPAYARKQTTWTPGAGGVLTGTAVTLDVQAGTYTHASLWTAATGGTCIDWVKITDTTLGAQGQIVVTPTYTQV